MIEVHSKIYCTGNKTINKNIAHESSSLFDSPFLYLPSLYQTQLCFRNVFPTAKLQFLAKLIHTAAGSLQVSSSFLVETGKQTIPSRASKIGAATAEPLVFFCADVFKNYTRTKRQSHKYSCFPLT